MKKYLTVFFAVAALSAAVASAEEKIDFKKCFKQCMKEIGDKDKCTYICDDSNDPPSK